MKKTDVFLLIPVICLVIFGLFIIYDISSFVALRDFGDKYHYIKDQFFWVGLGIAGLLFFANFNYRRLYNLSLPLLLLSIVLLVMVFIPGVGIKLLGAHRWINFRFFVLQPAEFVKMSLSIYLAAWFAHKEKGRFIAFLLLLGMVLGLIGLEPDMGTGIVVLFEALLVYFLSGGKIFYYVLLMPVLSIIGFLFVKLEPYRAKRLESFINLGQSIEGSSYHVKQILIALGTGGLTGVGLGNSLQKYAYLPETTTDSIFAIIAEELGFIGAVVVIVFFIFIIWRGFYIAIRSKDQFGKLLAGGLTGFIAIQAIINLGAQTALVPLTGIPLPFISYGGSSLIVDLCSIGIILNIAKTNN